MSGAGSRPGIRRRGWLRAGLLLSLAALAGFLILDAMEPQPLSGATAQAQAGWVRHIVQAELLVQDEHASLSTPLPSIVPPAGPVPESGTSEGWRPVYLPHVSVTRDTTLPADAKGMLITSWYRLQTGPVPPQAPALEQGSQGRNGPRQSNVQQGGQSSSQQSDLYLYLPRWQTVGRVAVYAEGQLVWRSSGDPVWNGFNQPLWIRLPQLPDSPGGALPAILLRMDSVPGLGGGITSAWIGTSEALIWRYRARFFIQDTVPAILTVAMLTLGLFVLAVWAVRPADPLYPLFTITSFLFAVRSIQYYWVLDPHLVPSAWFGWLTVNAMGWTVLADVLFNCRFVALKLPLIEGFMLVSMAACTILTMPPWQSSAQIAALATYAYLLCFVIAVPALPFVIRAAWRQRSWTGLMLAGWNLALFPVAAHDLAMVDYKISLAGVYLLPYAQIGWSLPCIYIVCRRYLEALKAVERLNASLGDRLRARENELRTIHERLRESEQRELLANERQRLMRDLHDGLGSSLVGAIRAVEHSAPSLHDPVVDMLRGCLDDLKLTVDSLEPVEADLLLVLASFRYRIQPRLHASDITLEWAVTPLPPLPWLTPTSALHILRIFQEVITNIVKHAGATRIRVSTEVTDTNITVRVTDDGRGFNPMPEQERASGRGLKNIRWRAASLSGHATWEASPHGTAFALALPIQMAPPGE